VGEESTDKKEASMRRPGIEDCPHWFIWQVSPPTGPRGKEEGELGGGIGATSAYEVAYILADRGGRTCLTPESQPRPKGEERGVRKRPKKRPRGQQGGGGQSKYTTPKTSDLLSQNNTVKGKS